MRPFERFTDETKAVLTVAQAEGERAGRRYIGTEHLLLALLASPSDASRLLEGRGVEIGAVRRTIDSVARSHASLPEAGPMVLTNRVKKVIEIAFHIAQREGSTHVTPLHLLRALLEEGEGIAAHVMADLGITTSTVDDAG